MTRYKVTYFGRTWEDSVWAETFGEAMAIASDLQRRGYHKISISSVRRIYEIPQNIILGEN